MLFVGLVPDDVIFSPEEIEYSAALSSRAKDYMRDLIITDAIAPHDKDIAWANYVLPSGNIWKGHGRYSKRVHTTYHNPKQDREITERNRALHSIRPLKGFRSRSISR